MMYTSGWKGQGLFRACITAPGVEVLEPLRHKPLATGEFVVRDPNGYVAVSGEGMAGADRAMTD